MSGSRWANLAVAYLALVGAFLPYIGWSPGLSDISEELGLSYSEAGSISSVTGLVAGVTILVGGVLASRWGAKQIILAGLAAGVVGQLVFAMADGLEFVMAGRVLAGLSVGFLWVATYTMAVDWFRDSGQTGRAVGIMMSGDGVGALLSLFAFSAVLAAFGWRLGLGVQAVFMLVVLVLVAVVSKNAPTTGADLVRVGDLPESQHPARPVEQSVRAIANRNVLSALIFWVGGVGLFSVIASWMPAILIEDAGMSESLAGFLTSLFSIVGMAAAFGAPLLAEKLGSKKPVIVVAGVLTAAALATMTLFVSTGNYVLVAICMPLIGLGVYAGEPLTLAAAVESVSAKHAGIVNGVIIGIPWIVSGFAFPYILGTVKDATGSFVQGFVALTVTTVVLCALSPLFIKKS
ncbi:MFS transporter [Mycobacterium sp. ITM-2016-00317]|uniref:MFS transporter n=1 Tax=Mycobacterium sp. ITM-2016-00317 TaxID=2099694 RepID=UPI00287F52A1|nr:MFS transporter [Mycobacterium sp. ITM-2016-00317]WNG88050.1 MFS transporter [Mycobacterium sp. ITM-2016-00317]